MTRPGSMLKAQIPIRTHADWNEQEPGYCEMDLVHHCDDSTGGEYLHTLTLTDVATGWTELAALTNRSAQAVQTALASIRARLPFALKGVDSDSGAEFVNKILHRYCLEEGIVFTRSRPNRKNDQCRVEQKNWSVVRANVGYDRYEGEQARKALAAFYRVLRVQVNFLGPSMMLSGKERVGARVRKRHDKAKTPCRRVLEHECVPEECKARLRELHAGVRPIWIAKEILKLREELRRFAK